MATTTLTSGQKSTGRITLTASTGSNNVDTVNAPAQWSHVRILSWGPGDIFFTTDGSAPTVDGKNTQILPGSSGAISYIDVPVDSSGASVIKLLSDQATKYVVQQLPDRAY